MYDKAQFDSEETRQLVLKLHKENGVHFCFDTTKIVKKEDIEQIIKFIHEYK